jgi:hypothetical protein
MQGLIGKYPAMFGNTYALGQGCGFGDVPRDAINKILVRIDVTANWMTGKKGSFLLRTSKQHDGSLTDVIE